jgi:hypothetical protein
MAPKRKKKKRVIADSQSTYVERRDERIAYYYFVRRVTKPPAIYDFLIRECRDCLAPDTGTPHNATEIKHQFVPLISHNRESGLRMVQKVVMRLRADAEPEEILKLRRPIETEKVRKSWEYLLQKQFDVIEDNSTVKVQKMSATGAIVSIIEPRCSEQAKARAGKAALQLIEKIGKLTGAVLVAEESEGEGDKPPGDKKQPEAFIFNFPNIKGSQSDLPDMIAMNLDKGKVN